MNIYIQQKFKLPNLPNFIRHCEGEGYMDIADLSDGDVLRVCDEWAKAFKAHVEHRRKSREQP